MALVNNNITIADNEKVIELLEKIISILGGGTDEKLRQEISDKLDKAISDIKNTIN